MNRPISVTQYISTLNMALAQVGQRVIGEVSSISFGPTGHGYFTIKDKDDSVLSCIIWKGKYRLLGVELKEGEQIIVSGTAKVYEKNGRLSVIADTIELAGEGKLKKEYEKLKKKLANEGLFASEGKRKIPYLPESIGVITSKSGAVMADFQSNISRHGFKIKHIDSRVEGQQAVSDIYSAIQQFKNMKLDLLVIMRGGGSLESLMAFNNELLVREIVKFPVPVIAAIGHDKDVPLISMAADVAVSTPTAAANLLNEAWDKVQLRFNQLQYQVWQDLDSIIDYCNRVMSTVRVVSQKVEYGIHAKAKYIQDKYLVITKFFDNYLSAQQVDLIKQWQDSIVASFRRELYRYNDKINNIAAITSYNDPERRLKMGYSIVRKDGRIIKNVDQVTVGDDLSIQVNKGILDSKIINIRGRKYDN